MLSTGHRNYIGRRKKLLPSSYLFWLLTLFIHCDKLFFVRMEEYPSLAEGIGLENRQAGYTARGFESLLLRHHSQAHNIGDIVQNSLQLCSEFFYVFLPCS
jgi:hypothetical protein